MSAHTALSRGCRLFVHVNDLEDVFRLEGPEVVMLPAETDEQAGGAAAAQAGGA